TRLLAEPQPKRHFRRCLRATMRPALAMSFSLCFVHTLHQCGVFQQLVYFFHPGFPQIFDVFRWSVVPQTWLPMSKLDHAASLISSDAASTRKATLPQCTTNRKSINIDYDPLFLRRKVA